MDLTAPARPILDAAIGSLCTACVLRVERGGGADTYAAGTLCPDASAGADAPCDADSLFDLASLTKLATTALVLSFVRDGALNLETPLRALVPDFASGAKDAVTLAQVLTHTAGLNWWKPLWKDAHSRADLVRAAALEPLAHEPGTVTYSDLGYVMLTDGLERVGGAPFDTLLRERLIAPVAASTLAFGPRPRERCAATEEDATWRCRRLRGEVHDENAFAMGGVAAHAGLFGTAADVAALARLFRDGAVIGEDLARAARREHARSADGNRRGLGVALRAAEGAMCGRHFGADAFGHSGFTGTSLWVDPQLDLTVVLLTNRVYFGRANGDALYPFRVAVHEAVSAPGLA